MNINEIKVSVITPTFNDEQFIKKTINSILNQTHSNLEIIIVDDCSTDQTIKIINSFNDPRIKLFINDNNSGAAFSRNRALREATGDYVAFLDGDDLWDKDKISNQLTFMVGKNVNFSYTNYRVIDDADKSLGYYLTGPSVVSHKKFLRMDYVGCLTVMFKRSIFPNLQIPNSIRKRNDYALWLKISEKAECYLFNEVLSSYRKRKSGSISSTKKVNLLAYHYDLFRKLYNYSSIKAWIFCLRNALFYLLKQIMYKKRNN